MSLDKVAAVFDATEDAADDDDEDVEALMKELYDEAETTKDWCRYQGAEIEEEKEEPLEEQGEEEVEDEPVSNSDEKGATMETLHKTPVHGIRGNFLGYLEESAAGKHENFQGYDVPTTRGWTDELRRTAEAAAANVDAVTGSLSGSKTVDRTIASGTRFLAYAVMLASVITLCAKASVTRDEAAAKEVAMATASQSLSDLKPIDTNKLDSSSTDTNKLDPTGEFTEIDEEVRHSDHEEEDHRAEDRKRNHVAEEMHEKYILNREDKEQADRDDDNKQEKIAIEKEEDQKRETLTQERDKIKQVLEIAKSLERREKEENGKVDNETATILQAARTLASKALTSDKERTKTETAEDHALQDALRKKRVQEQAKHEAMKLLQDSHGEKSSTIENQVAESIKKEALEKEEEERRRREEKEVDRQRAAHLKAAKEEEHRLKLKIEEQQQQQREDNRRMLEIAKQKVQQSHFMELQDMKVNNMAPDTNAECGAWAKDGECHNNAVWMLENCAQSCAQLKLRDQDHRCQSWADGGECENNAIYMRHHCPESCGLSAPAPAPPAADFARAKRAAGLKKKMKAQQVKDNSRPFIVRGKGLAKAAEEVLEEHDNMNWHGRGAHAHTQYKSAEDSLLEKLSSIPEATVDMDIMRPHGIPEAAAGSWTR